MASNETERSQPGPDRRRQVTSCAAAASIAIAVLWAAGLPPSEWLSRLHGLTAKTVPQAKETSASALVSVPAQPAAHSASSVDTNILAGTDSSLSKVPLPLYLLGVAPGRNVTEGTAQIGTSIENPQTYSAGAMLVNGARLAEIHVDHVLLTKGDRSVRLDLYRRNNPGAAAANHDELLTVGGAPIAAPGEPANQETLTDYLRPSPVYDGEILRGYKLYPGKSSGVFSQLGLRPGDVITAIDGAPLIGRAETIQTLELLTEGAALSVAIERGGTHLQITLDGTLILAERERVQMLSHSSAANRPAT